MKNTNTAIFGRGPVVAFAVVEGSENPGHIPISDENQPSRPDENQPSREERDDMPREEGRHQGGDSHIPSVDPNTRELPNIEDIDETTEDPRRLDPTDPENEPSDDPPLDDEEVSAPTRSPEEVPDPGLEEVDQTDVTEVPDQGPPRDNIDRDPTFVPGTDRDDREEPPII